VEFHAFFIPEHQHKHKQHRKILLWDGGGNRRFTNIVNSFYTGLDCILVFCNMNDRSTFNGVDYWLNNIYEKKENQQIPVLIVGMKSLDIKNTYMTHVTEMELEEYAERMGVDCDYVDIKNINQSCNVIHNYIQNMFMSEYNYRSDMPEFKLKRSDSKISWFVSKMYNLCWRCTL
jgi:GTPase SAR1 family protein